MMTLKAGAVFVTTAFVASKSAKTHVLAAFAALTFLKLVVDVTVMAELKAPRVVAKLSLVKPTDSVGTNIVSMV